MNDKKLLELLDEVMGWIERELDYDKKDSYRQGLGYEAEDFLYDYKQLKEKKE